MKRFYFIPTTVMGSPTTVPHPTNQDAPTATEKPVAIFRFGDVSAAIFSDEVKTKDGRTFRVENVSLRRSFKDEKGEWHQTTGLRQDDLLLGAFALTKCFDFIAEARGEAKA